MADVTVMAIPSDKYAALQLADLLATITSKAAQSGADAAAHIGDPECLRFMGRLEMGREIADVIAKRIAVLTGGA